MLPLLVHPLRVKPRSAGGEENRTAACDAFRKTSKLQRCCSLLSSSSLTADPHWKWTCWDSQKHSSFTGERAHTHTHTTRAEDEFWSASDGCGWKLPPHKKHPNVSFRDLIGLAAPLSPAVTGPNLRTVDVVLNSRSTSSPPPALPLHTSLWPRSPTDARSDHRQRRRQRSSSQRELNRRHLISARPDTRN